MAAPKSIRSPDFAALLASVEASPEDDAPKLVMADYLDEREIEPDLSRGLRWCVREGLWPVLRTTIEGRRWFWEHPIYLYRRSVLPNEIDWWLTVNGGWNGELCWVISQTGRAIYEVVGIP